MTDDTMSPQQPLSPFVSLPLLCEDEGCPPDHLSGSLAGDCVWCWGKMEEWMFPPENRNKSTRVGQMPGRLAGQERRLVFILNYSAGKFIGYN